MKPISVTQNASSPLKASPSTLCKNPSLVGHLAVVTGASSGIGKEFARQLAAMGSDLVIVARRLDRLKTLASELTEKYGVQVECLESDLTQPGAPKKLFDEATSSGRKVTILVNNAGVGKFGNFTEFSLSEHLSTLQINSVVPTELSYLFVKHMLEHGKKSYLSQVASIAAFQPTGFFTVYSGSKGYLRVFSETLAYELRDTNIDVTCTCPGGTYTEFFEHSGQEITPSGRLTMMSSEAVVRKSIQAMLRGQRVFVPGLLNKIACFVPRFVPRGLSLELAFRAMNRAVKRVPAKGEKTST